MNDGASNHVLPVTRILFCRERAIVDFIHMKIMKKEEAMLGTIVMMR